MYYGNGENAYYMLSTLRGDSQQLESNKIFRKFLQAEWLSAGKSKQGDGVEI
jgi:hypothetical protein